MTMGWLQGEVEGKDMVKERPQKGLETVFHSIIHLLWKKDALGNSMEIQCWERRINKVTGKE